MLIPLLKIGDGDLVEVADPRFLLGQIHGNWLVDVYFGRPDGIVIRRQTYLDFEWLSNLLDLNGALEQQSVLTGHSR